MLQRALMLIAGAGLALAAPAEAAKCPQDAVPVGHLCVDKAQLTGALPRGTAADDYGPGSAPRKNATEAPGSP